MKVGIREGGIPADHHITANDHFQLAEQYGVSEVAMVADLDPSLFAQREVHPIHCAARTNNERGIAAAPKSLESVACGDHRVFGYTRVGRKSSVGPIARLRLSRLHQRASAKAKPEPVWRACRY